MPFKSIIAEVAETPREEPERRNVEEHPQVAKARSWADLEAALDHAQAAYERGAMTREQVEVMAIQATQKARELPTTIVPSTTPITQ